ncbi:MAG TPA: hypothetical protein VG871_14415 [Vicinamibacterales bacterium]|nr:hypothetical protein [Vicinamibacterales bacterium]
MSFDRVVPLTPHRTPLPRERRRQIRVDTLGQVEAHSVWKLQPMWLREISLAGFSIETTTPHEIGTLSKFRLTVDGQNRSVVVQARAKYCTELPAAAGSLTIYVVGFEIVAPTESIVRELTAFIDYAESLWT